VLDYILLHRLLIRSKHNRVVLPKIYMCSILQLSEHKLYRGYFHTFLALIPVPCLNQIINGNRPIQISSLFIIIFPSHTSPRPLNETQNFKQNTHTQKYFVFFKSVLSLPAQSTVDFLPVSAAAVQGTVALFLGHRGHLDCVQDSKD
jgi:hypothetical protein